jgi:hypothetical protein
MMRNEAIRLAESWVRDKFPMVPEVEMARWYPPPIPEMTPGDNPLIPAAGPCPAGGAWLVVFACPETAEPATMPKRLTVCVDRDTGAVELIPGSV